MFFEKRKHEGKLEQIKNIGSSSVTKDNKLIRNVVQVYIYFMLYRFHMIGVRMSR